MYKRYDKNIFMKRVTVLSSTQIIKCGLTKGPFWLYWVACIEVKKECKKKSTGDWTKRSRFSPFNKFRRPTSKRWLWIANNNCLKFIRGENVVLQEVPLCENICKPLYFLILVRPKKSNWCRLLNRKNQSCRHIKMF